MNSELTVTVDKCKVKRQVMRLAWIVIKSFLKGRAREKKGKALWSHEVRVLINVHESALKRLDHGRYEIWIGEVHVKKIEVDMEVQ